MFYICIIMPLLIFFYKKKFNLVNEDIDFDNPDDISYVYLAYAPLSYKIIQD